MNDRIAPSVLAVETVAVSTDTFHYEPVRREDFPVAYFFEDKGIWVNAHDDFEILYVEAGRIRLFVEDTQLIIRAGEAVVINPRCVHFGFLDAGTRHGVILCKDQITPKGAAFPDAQIFARIVRGELFFARRVLTRETDAEILQVIRSLLDAYRIQSSYWRAEVISYLFAFAAVCLRNGFLRADVASSGIHTDKTGSDIALYLQFTRYVNTHYDTPLALSSIAADLGVSESKLYKVCCSIQGYAPNTYILNRRMQEAERLLRTGEQNVTEICYACGFSSVSYFISRFRAVYGITPKQFRENCTEK